MKKDVSDNDNSYSERFTRTTSEFSKKTRFYEKWAGFKDSLEVCRGKDRSVRGERSVKAHEKA